MNDWFEWGGVRCTDYGIHVSEQPPITIPKERTTQVTVPGRPGTVTVTEGADVYENKTLTAKCWLADPTVIPEVAAWLKGRNTLTFANRQGGHYYARLSNQVLFKRILRGNPHVSFDIEFLCSPFWYPDNVQETDIPASNNVVSHIMSGVGSVYSQPKITVHGSGSINLMVNGATVYLDDISDPITIDCDSGIAYTFDANDQKVFAGEHVSLEDGEWPRLQPNGYANRISGTASGNGSTLTKVIIQPNWRYL